MSPFQSLRDYERFVYTLQATFPSNIKHNRIPAPGLSFDQPNLPLLIAEIEQLAASQTEQ